MKTGYDAHGISVIFFDVDGTLTDGKIYYDSDGNEMKAFNIKDGLIISAMIKMGYLFVVVTGRKSEIVKKRMEELGVKEIFQGISEKALFVSEYIKKNKLQQAGYAYLGDDLNDISAMKMASFKGCPADACEQILEMADYISERNCGDGAVREILEELLKKNGDWVRFIQLFDESNMAT